MYNYFIGESFPVSSCKQLSSGALSAPLAGGGAEGGQAPQAAFPDCASLLPLSQLQAVGSYRVGAARFMELTPRGSSHSLPGGRPLCTALCVGGTQDGGVVLGHWELGALGPYFLLLACLPLCPGGRSCPARLLGEGHVPGETGQRRPSHEADRPTGDGQCRQWASALIPLPWTQEDAPGRTACAQADGAQLQL